MDEETTGLTRKEIYEIPGIMEKSNSLKFCKIRKITKAQVINTDFPLLPFKCTCPNSKEVGYCIHILGVLIKLKLISTASFLKKAKRGRPAHVSNAYEYESASDDENT